MLTMFLYSGQNDREINYISRVPEATWVFVWFYERKMAKIRVRDLAHDVTYWNWNTGKVARLGFGIASSSCPRRISTIWRDSEGGVIVSSLGLYNFPIESEQQTKVSSAMNEILRWDRTIPINEASTLNYSQTDGWWVWYAPLRYLKFIFTHKQK